MGGSHDQGYNLMRSDSETGGVSTMQFALDTMRLFSRRSVVLPAPSALADGLRPDGALRAIHDFADTVTGKDRSVAHPVHSGPAPRA